MNSFRNEFIRQRPGDISRIMDLINSEYSAYYSELQQYGIEPNIVRRAFEAIVRYVLTNEQKYSGNITQKTEQILNALQESIKLIPYTFSSFGIPDRRAYEIIQDIIRITLETKQEI